MCQVKTLTPAVHHDKFDRELTDKDQVNLDLKMMVFLWFKSEVTPRCRKMAQLDNSHSLQRTLVEIGGEKFVAHLRLFRLRGRVVTTMKEHAKLDRDTFAVRRVTLGLRVDVSCAPEGLMMSMVLLASFTTGGNWVINADTLKTIVPSVDCSAVQARCNDA